jgi:U4/U6.U5 tri-snRNP-associated protein 1
LLNICANCFPDNLNQKEAFKELSHQFHGKGSGKQKQEKRLKKLEDEKKRMGQSLLNVNSTGGKGDGKTKREAGVRLQ